ncbi:MAG: AAA family ATPase [Chloroflexi bacterium]|nr:AAA family ATPase [Chloroflexota bacterium]
MVGRDDEQRRLAAALDSAADGQGGTVFLTGQPGIGKTRMAREALALAGERGFTVLEGRAFPLETGLAYAPLIDAFALLLRNLPSSSLQTLVDGLTDLGRMFVDLRIPAPSFPEGPGDPALEKTRLFEAMSRLVERLTVTAPVALLIDDVQWADPASLEMLHYLARGLPDRRALLLATFVDEAWDSSPGLRSLVESLEREGLSEEIVLSSLEPAAVEAMMRGILDGCGPGGHPGAVPGELVSLLNARARGTPLFVEALIAAFKDSGGLVYRDGAWHLDPERAGALPRSIRRLILKRLHILTPTERRVLDLISIMGDAAPHTILRASSGLEEDVLLDAVGHLRAIGLVAEGVDRSEVAYSIVHPLVQEVAYSELPEMTRRRAHVAVIKAIERCQAGDLLTASGETIARLAHHYRGAGPEADRDRALAALMAAGEQALVVYANEEAARHFIKALAMVREGGHVMGVAGSDEPILPWLLERLGEAWDRVGDGSAAITVWSKALAERERVGPTEERAVAVARLHRRLALAENDRGHLGLAEAHLKDGLAALPGPEPCQELADLYFARYYILGRLGDIPGAVQTAEKLLTVAGQLGSPGAEAEANLAASISCLWQGDISRARERALHALAVGRIAHELAICCRAHRHLTSIEMRYGDHHLGRRHAENGVAVAQQLGAPTDEALLRARLACASFMAGDWDEARRSSREAVELARRVGQPRAIARSLAERAMILALQGDLAEVEACISEVRVVFGGGPPIDRTIYGLVDIAETACALGRGQAKHALSIAQGFVRQAPGAPLPTGLPMAFMPIGYTLLAEAQAAAGDTAGALKTAGSLLTLGPSGAPYLEALASRAEGLARQALGQWEAAIASFSRAHEKFTSVEMPFEAAKTLLEQAAVSRAVRPELAVRMAQDSLAVFERLDAQCYVERARRLLRGLGITTLATRRPRLGKASVSGRELEIARLVAEGLSNSEIAKRLTLSPFTVTSHLHRIYTRLGIGSRAALARLVIQSGMLSTR